MDAPVFVFKKHDEHLAIARHSPDAAWPAWARGRFVSVTRTRAELSVICAQKHVPATVKCERDKVAFGIVGVVPMTSIGILAQLCGALAAAAVPVFAISTYDTDYLLVSADRVEATTAALLALGHRVE